MPEFNNGFTLNLAAEPPPCGTRENALWKAVTSLLPNYTNISAGNTVCDGTVATQHRHHRLNMPDNSATMIDITATGYVGYGMVGGAAPAARHHFYLGTRTGYAPTVTTTLAVDSNAGTASIEFLYNPSIYCYLRFNDNVAAHTGYIGYWNYGPALIYSGYKTYSRNTLATTVHSDGTLNRFYIAGSGVDIIPEATLHVMGYDAGATGGGVATFEGDGDSSTNKIYFLTPNDDHFSLFFGDSDDNDIGKIVYEHTDNSMNFYTNAGATQVLRLNSAGLIGTNTNAAAFSVTATNAGNIDINGKAIRIRTAVTPFTSAVAGNTGEIMWDASYIYVYTGAAWKRATLAAF